MRTPLVLVCGQGDADGVAETLMKSPGTAVIGHEFDGHVVRRWVSILRHGEPSTSEVALELRKGCVSCTVRNDLLVLLRRIHRRDDVDRIAVLLARWMEPEPVCYAINHVRVHVGTGYIDGPAVRDVEIRAVVACIDADTWLTQTLGNEELDDGRTVAQVVVGQAEFADAVVLTEPERTTLAVLKSRCACIPLSIHCSAASSVPVVASGWPPNPTTSGGSNRPVAVCASPTPVPGWPR